MPRGRASEIKSSVQLVAQWEQPHKKLPSLSSGRTLLILPLVESSVCGGLGAGHGSPGVGGSPSARCEDIRAEVRPSKLELNHFVQMKAYLCESYAYATGGEIVKV